MRAFRHFGFTWMIGLAVATGVPAEEPLLSVRDLESLGYVPYWEVPLDFTRGGAVRAAYLRDDTVYVITDEGDVHAIHAGAGVSRWAQNLTASVYRIFPPSHFFDAEGKPLVVFATSPRTIIIDRYAGDVVADMPLDRATASAAVADAENIYFGSNDGHLYCMTWSDPRAQEAVFRWRVLAGGPVSSSPALVNEGRDIVFASQGGGVYNCTSEFKILNWQFKTEDPITADIVVDESGVYVAGTDRSLYRLDTTSGVARWRARFEEPLHDAPVVTGRSVYQSTETEGVVALDADTGQRLWSIAEADGFLCRDLDEVILTTPAGRLLKVDALSGRVVASVRLADRAVPVPNANDATIYLVSTRGRVLCAKPKGTPHLTPEQMSLARRQRNIAPAATAGDEPPRPRERGGVSAIDMNDPLRSGNDIPPLGGGGE